MPYELGVDLGTTFTAAAVREDAGRGASGAAGEPTMLGLGNRALQVPSVLFRTDAGFVVGEAAERRGTAEPRRLVREFKRRLGDPVPVLVDGVPFSAESLSATLLRWVVDSATRQRGEPPAGLVLTHPASWGEFKLDVLRQVAALAEVGPARWCAEPVAAAGQYASRSRVAVGERLGVYDLGGGTFDACVLEQTDAGFSMLGPAEGVEHLGGVDFDEAVFDQVRTVLADRLGGVDVDDPGVVSGLARLRRECVEAKEALSVDAETSVQVALPGLVTAVRVTRAELEGLIGPSVEQTVAAMARAIRAAGLEPSDLSGIVLVGGSSRIPLVGEVLQQRFEVPTALDTHPKHDIALGSLRTGAAAAPAAAAVPAPARSRPPRRRSQPPPAPPPAEPEAPTGPVQVAAVEPTPAPAAARAAGRAPSPVAQEPPGSPVPSRSGPLRRGVLVGAGALVLVAAVLLVVRMATGPGRAVPVTTPGPVTSSAVDAPTPTNPLPQSDAVPEGDLLLSMEKDGGTAIYRTSAQQPAPLTRLTTTSGTDVFPVLSPDRRTMIYLRFLDGDGRRRELRVAAADGSDDQPAVDPVPPQCDQRPSRPAWNPVRTDELAVVCLDSSGRTTLFLASTDGSLTRQIPLPGKVAGDPTFSPDGSRLAFWSASDAGSNGGDLYVVAADGSGSATRLTKATRASEYADPAFSPDGTRLAFRKRDAGRTAAGDLNVYVMKADGSGAQRRLVDGERTSEQDPAWSPDGNQLVYVSDAPTSEVGGGRVSRIWKVNSDGTDAHPLLTTGSPGPQGSVLWTRR